MHFDQKFASCPCFSGALQLLYSHMCCASGEQRCWALCRHKVSKSHSLQCRTFLLLISSALWGRLDNGSLLFTALLGSGSSSPLSFGCAISHREERKEKPAGNTTFSQPALPTPSNRWTARASFSPTPLKASCNAICTLVILRAGFSLG